MIRTADCLLPNEHYWRRSQWIKFIWQSLFNVSRYGTHYSLSDIAYSVHTYIHNWPLQPFSQDYGLASHTTYIVCVFIRAWWDLQSNVDSERQIFWETFSFQVYLLSEFLPEICWKEKVTVCCGFWSRGIIEPFFFENEQGEAVTVNGDPYRAMLNEFLFTKIEEKDIDNIWYRQVSAMCHTTEATLDDLPAAALSAAEQMLFGHLRAAVWHS